MFYNQNTLDAIAEYLGCCDMEELLTIARQMNGINNSCDSLVWYDMDELDEFTCGMNHWEVLRLAHFGDFNPMHNYFRFDNYGNLESCDHLRYDENDIAEIQDSLVECDFSDLPADIQDIILDNED